MTRDGFTLLAMGFTGAKALEFKRKYIEQFNAMEAMLRAAGPPPASPRFDLSDTKFLQGLARPSPVDAEGGLPSFGETSVYLRAIQGPLRTRPAGIRHDTGRLHAAGDGFHRRKGAGTDRVGAGGAPAAATYKPRDAINLPHATCAPGWPTRIAR